MFDASSGQSLAELITSAYYNKGLRNVLTTGLLGMSSFLFAFFSFGLGQIKTQILDAEDYREMYARKTNQFDHIELKGIYTPLHRLTALVVFSMVTAFFAVAAHLVLFIWTSSLIMWVALCVSALSMTGFMMTVTLMMGFIINMMGGLVVKANSDVKERARTRRFRPRA